MAAMKAVRVLPEPVGAATSVWRPPSIDGQACDLRLRRARKRAREPAGDGGMEEFEDGERADMADGLSAWGTRAG